MPPLLAAGLEAWARESDGDNQALVQDSPPGKNPRLHACLRMLLDLRTERSQRRWAFRAIASDSPRAVQTRLRKAIRAPASPRAAWATPSAACSCSGPPRGRAARSPRRRRRSSRTRAVWSCQPAKRT